MVQQERKRRERGGKEDGREVGKKKEEGKRMKKGGREGGKERERDRRRRREDPVAVTRHTEVQDYSKGVSHLCDKLQPGYVLILFIHVTVLK